MEKIIIDGATGTGKTFRAINMALKIGSFIYSAPCRQLVYETMIKYGSKKSNLLTGEISIFNRNNKNTFCVFESLNYEMIQKHQTLIIDEAHFLTDSDRGAHLYEMLTYADKLEKNIFLISATRNFRKIKNFKILKMKNLFSKKIIKKEISEEEYVKRLQSGISSIRFIRYKSDAKYYKNSITADTPADKRLKLQLDFAKGLITKIAATNVVAQGLNFPASNILIEYNPYDSEEVINQKIGRLGRYGFEFQELTYCLKSIKKPKVKKNKKIKKISNKILITKKDLFENFWFLNEKLKKYLCVCFENAPIHEYIMSKYGINRTKKFYDISKNEEFVSEKEKEFFENLEEFVLYHEQIEQNLKNLLFENIK